MAPLDPKSGRLLYHLTALDNLESIILNDLRPRSLMRNFVDIADQEILKDREKFDLAQYTPFHFFSGSPFSGKVQKMNPDKEFVYITMKRDDAQRGQFKIVPRHPLSYNGEPLEWNEGFEVIDWDLMATRDYSNHECKEACMAESVFMGSIPMRYFHCIYVRNIETKQKVENLFSKCNCVGIIFVNVNQGMFINHD